MTTLYWHVVDSQSFPLQIPGFEEVSFRGAYSKSSIYSPVDVAEIVSYAASVRSFRRECIGSMLKHR
jgi:hexosaminidase